MGLEGEAVWAEWLRVTRFLEGARLALAREQNILSSLNISPKSTISVTAGKGKYQVDLEGHLEAVADDEMLFGAVLLHSYALVEAAAASKLALKAGAFPGIESWGQRLLESEGNSWADLDDGQAGAVEVAVARNAIAHGTWEINAAAYGRLQTAGSSSWTENERISLDYETLKLYRYRLRSLMRLGGIRKP